MSPFLFPVTPLWIWYKLFINYMQNASLAFLSVFCIHLWVCFFLSLFCLKKCNFLSKIFKSEHNINQQNVKRSFLYVSLRIWTGTDINKPQPRLKCLWDVSIGLIIQKRRISKKNLISNSLLKNVHVYLFEIPPLLSFRTNICRHI